MRYSVFWRSREQAWRGAIYGEDGKPTVRGEIILNYLRELCHMDSTTENDDPHKTSFNNGKRQVGLEIMKLLEMDWAAIYKLQEDEVDG